MNAKAKRRSAQAYTRAAMYDFYDRAACAVMDAMEAEPDEVQASKLEDMYLVLANMREKYDGLG